MFTRQNHKRRWALFNWLVFCGLKVEMLAFGAACFLRKEGRVDWIRSVLW